jgi:hypothetical protein
LILTLLEGDANVETMLLMMHKIWADLPLAGFVDEGINSMGSSKAWETLVVAE